MQWRELREGPIPDKVLRDFRDGLSMYAQPEAERGRNAQAAAERDIAYRGRPLGLMP